jgi:hypothetical protein
VEPVDRLTVELQQAELDEVANLAFKRIEAGRVDDPIAYVFGPAGTT